MPYDRDRFAFWHRWAQDCITAFHREYVPHGELYRMARLGPIDREAVFERFTTRPPAYSTKRSLHRAVRPAFKYVAHRRPRADAIIITPEEVYILKVKRHPTHLDLDRLEGYAALFAASLSKPRPPASNSSWLTTTPAYIPFEKTCHSPFHLFI